VPTRDGLGRDDDRSLLPFWPQSADGDPEELVDDAGHGPRVPPLQHGDLLAKNQVLYDRTPMATKEADERPEPEQKQVEQGTEF